MAGRRSLKYITKSLSILEQNKDKAKKYEDSAIIDRMQSLDKTIKVKINGNEYNNTPF